MKSRDTFEKIRHSQKQFFNLNIRLSLFVTAEMFVAILAAFGIDYLLDRFIFKDYEFPLLVELLVVAALIGIFVTHALSKYFFSPLKKLGNAMEDVADGNFEVRLDTDVYSREIREVYSGFNMMASELGSTEILRTNFVSAVSHEFKTPIAAIEGYTTLLQGCPNLDEEQNEYIEKILMNTSRLSTLASNMLLLSKIENQSISLNQSEFSLDEQIRKSVVALESVWSKKNIQFDVELQKCRYYGNEMLLHHVWDNIIGNAIKFSHEGGTVRIKLAKVNGKIIITFDDMGEGISEEAKKHIFDKFYQADTSHKTEGNGLGLPLAKRVLELEDGSIGAENLREGGCRFTVILSNEKDSIDNE